MKGLCKQLGLPPGAVVSGAYFDPQPLTPEEFRAEAQQAENSAQNALCEAADYQDQAKDLREQAQKLEATPAWWLKAKRLYYHLRGPRTLFKL